MAEQFTDLDYTAQDQYGQDYQQYDQEGGYIEGQDPNLVAQPEQGEVRRERRKKKRREEGEGGEERRHRRHRKKSRDAGEEGEEVPAEEGENGERKKKRRHHRRHREERPEAEEELEVPSGPPPDLPEGNIPYQEYPEDNVPEHDPSVLQPHNGVNGEEQEDVMYPSYPEEGDNTFDRNRQRPHYNDVENYDPEYQPEAEHYQPQYEPEQEHYQPEYEPEQEHYQPEYEPEQEHYQPEYQPEQEHYQPEYEREMQQVHYEDQHDLEYPPSPVWHPEDGGGVHHFGPNDNYGPPMQHQRPPPPPAKEEKKKGALGKLFSFTKKKRTPSNSSDQGSQLSAGPDSVLHDNWSSNPQIFNPSLDTLDRPQQRGRGGGGAQPKMKGKAVRPLPSAMAHVVMLDGEEVEVSMDKKATGQMLFDQLCKALQLVEIDYFGITWVNKKARTWFWLDLDKKITKQLAHGEEWYFNFQVKFYPPEPSLLQEDLTRYLLTLQVRQDIYTGKLPCSWVTQALLGSFMVQSELGDYEPEEYGQGTDYLREFEFVEQQSENLLGKIAELHIKNKGMSPDQADYKYLETAKRLDQYGVDLHPAQDMDDIPIAIGICFNGVVVYRDRLRIGRFAWPKVLRIAYKKNQFYLKIRSDYYEDVDAIVGFKLGNHRLAKRLWKVAVEHHTFFRLKEPRLTAKSKMMPGLGSKHRFSGRTFFQYRTMSIDRPRPSFDRSLTKRRSCSMPTGLDRAGVQYSSMHSLNRVHPRDMTLGKTQSVEYLGPRRYGSTSGSLNDMPSTGGRVVTRNNQAPFSTPPVQRPVGGTGSRESSDVGYKPPTVQPAYRPPSNKGSDIKAAPRPNQLSTGPPTGRPRPAAGNNRFKPAYQPQPQILGPDDSTPDQPTPPPPPRQTQPPVRMAPQVYLDADEELL